MAKMTGAQAIVRYFEEEKVEYVFGMAGHANLTFLDALCDSKIQFISVPHEQIAVHMADCYFRVTHRPGVVLTSLGPGFTNTVTGIADAMHDCSGVVMISGNAPVSHSGMSAYQEVAFHRDGSQMDILRPIMKYAWRVDHAHLIPYIIPRAFNMALTGCPGPVLVDVPMDILSKSDDFPPPDSSSRRARELRTGASQEDLDRALTILTEAQRPLIFAGGGVLLSDASEELTELAERLEIPVIATLIAQSSIRNDHRLYGGVTGAVGTPTAHLLASRADAVLAIGTRFSDIDCNSWHPEYFFNAPPAKIVQIDINSAEVGRRFPVEVGIVADAKTVLRQLIAAAKSDPPPKERRAWLAELEEARGMWKSEIELSQKSDEHPIVVERLVAEIRAALPPEGIIIAPNGARYFVAQHFTALGPRTHMVASGHGTMGWAVAASLGAKLGKPEAPVVCLTGDGGFRSVSPTLAVAVEHNIPVVWTILNNSSFNIIELIQNRFMERQIGALFSTPDGKPYNPDFAAMARAYGAEGVRVERAEEIGPSLAKAVASGRPYVLDVITTQRPNLRASGFWGANQYLKPGWNEMEGSELASGFGDSG